MKVSVITPFYNGNAYMERYQRMMEANLRAMPEGHSLEVILVNDSPETAVSLSGIFRGQSQVRVLTHEKNMGIHAARLTGLAAADGDYVIFLDQDDLLADDAIAQLLTEAERIAKADGSRRCCRVIVSNAYLEQGDGSKQLWYRNEAHKKLIGNLHTYVTVGTQIISPGQCLLNRELIPQAWREHVCRKNGADDYYLWLLLLQSGVSFSLYDFPLYTHCHTPENVSADTTVTDTSSMEFLSYLREDPDFPKETADRLEEMLTYKAEFRTSGLAGRIGLSLSHFRIFAANVSFKIKTGTYYGFNRS